MLLNRNTDVTFTFIEPALVMDNLITNCAIRANQALKAEFFFKLPKNKVHKDHRIYAHKKITKYSKY